MLNNKTTLSIAIVLGVVGLAGVGYYKQNSVSHSADNPDSVKTKADVERIIREYTIANPEFLEEAMKNLYVKKAKAESERSEKAVKDKQRELTENMFDPRAGNTNPKLRIVEFFDYNCGYCKHMLETKQKILAELPDVQIIFKEFPILGESSRMLAKAALAVNAVDSAKYFEFHSKLMSMPGDKSLAVIEDTVSKMGIDLAKFKTAMNDAKIEEQLNQNLQLAGDIGLRGTPAYVIGDQLVPGAISLEEVKKIIAEKTKAQ